VKGRLVSQLIALASLVASASGVGCTALVSFDDHPTNTCGVGFDGGLLGCDGGPDGTLFGDANEELDVTVVVGFDGESFDGADGAGGSADVGDCSVLSEGEPCAKPDACREVATCHAGVCTAHPRADGTSCGAAPDVCHDGAVCMGGLCADPANAADGTSCGDAPDDCHDPAVCTGGACAAAAVADGTTCGNAPDDCHDAPACTGGVCGGPTNAPNGTKCGAAPDDCHEAPVCSGGTCAGAADAPNGTKCGTAPDACHDAPVCSGGTCQKAVALAEGTEWKSGDTHARCCSGSPVETTSDTNCGVCGWKCGSGQSCTVVDGEYFCTGCTDNASCASGCCSLTTKDHCSPSNCAGACRADVCTGGSHCVVGSTVDYCAY
jgi:hypothetical protein